MTIALSVLLGFIALWWALRFLPAGTDGHGPLPYLIAFVRFLWIPSIIILTAALISCHWILAGIAAILTIFTGVFASPWYRKLHNISARQNPARRVSQDKRIQNTDTSVMTLNCRYGHADPSAIITAIRGNDVSILALQELTPELIAALDKEGINELLPYRQLGKPAESDNGGFNGIFWRTEADSQAGSTVDIAAADVPYCEINGISVYSVHPKSPMRGCKEWSQGIRKLAELIPKSASAIPLTAFSTSSPEKAAHEAIIMGDLNSNLDHPSFRKLLDAGFEDAGLTTSHAHAASFPQWLIWPRLELDHILITSDLATSNLHTLAIPGSDHFALLTGLRHL